MKHNKLPRCKTISIGLIGPGLIGRTLLQQIHDVMKQSRASHSVNFYVYGIMKSKQMLLTHRPMDLETWENQLHQCDVVSNLNAFIKHMLVNKKANPVIIDCTASTGVSREYLNMLQKGIHVITPNKHANAGELDYYKQIKQQMINGNARYFYEATVGAGLPIISTLQEMIKTGDRVLKIEGVISGTLNYIFSELAKGRLFSEVVMEAKRMGVTEPDPREDLLGIDVARKLVCLAREIGYETDLAHVNVQSLIPTELNSCKNIEDFYEELPRYDSQMQDLVSKAVAVNQQLCYVGTIDANEEISVGIKSLSKNHPFTRLGKKNNMLIFHTQRYQDDPLIIEGPVAGEHLTASGIFADLFRLV